MAALIKFNHENVLLRYADPAELRDFHRLEKPQPSDRERNALIAAERELITLKIIAEHSDLSDIGMTRIVDALRIIQRALEMKRPPLGMGALSEPA